jgi:transcriptional regulator of acetoin/glycerol metabolism
MEKLIQYDWPGNVRELKNIIERGVILSPGDSFRVPEFGANQYDSIESKTIYTLKETERRQILWALRKTDWKVRGPKGAAELLDIHPSTLASRMKKLGVQRTKDVPKRKSILPRDPLGIS